MRMFIQDTALIDAKVSIRMRTNSQGRHSLFLIHLICMIGEGSTKYCIESFSKLNLGTPRTILISDHLYSDKKSIEAFQEYW